MINTLITRDIGKITEEIDSYIKEVQMRTRQKIENSTSLPIEQHMVPRFILRQIAAIDPANSTKEKGLLLKEYTLHFDPLTSDLSDFIASKELVSPNQYSIRKELYNSSSLEHEYFLEMMFSIIETDASRILRSRISHKYNTEVAELINPFVFHLPELSQKPNKIRIRTILSTFFSIQFLRPEFRKGALKALGEKRGVSQRDFAGQILYFLMPTVLQTYTRQWVWVKFPNHELFISELGLITSSTCSGKAAALMPISRSDLIYFHESPSTHFENNDKIAYSESSILYDWYYHSMLEQICNYEIKDLKNGNQTISFVSNRDSLFSRDNFYKTRECCLSCVLKPITSNISDKIFLAKDIDSSSMTN